MDEEQRQQQQQPQLDQQLEDQSPPLPPVPTFDTDRPMSEVEPTPSYSVLDDFEYIANKELAPLEEDIIETKCFHWDIEHWSQLDQRVIGPVMKAGGHDWNILLFPGGNHQNEYASIYLDLSNAKENPEEYACAQFVILLSRPSEPTRHQVHQAQHRFTSDESDWGFTRFITLESLAGPHSLLENDAIRITTIIRVVKDVTGVLWHNFINYNSKKQTGYVGLQNQGATCYMNSLFQSLYFTNSFRKAVFQIPTEHDEPSKSVALALQRCFYNLQYSSEPVGTTELTKSFGWDSLEAFRQHDVQEFNRVLQDSLETKMKDTPADGAIKNLFVGRMKSYIKCINVDYESSRSEDYYDIQLNVKGCKNLEESFQDYITEETLEGDNKYMAEGYGLQDAKKGVIFESFPPVLHLQLKRFEYDMMRDMMVKINDRHEFPTHIDLEPYLSDTADKSMSHKYALHGVLVHCGDLSGGHYFAFVKPEKDGKWFKFDDDRVVPCSMREVLEDNFGGEHPGLANIRPHGRPMNRFTNAYMLVYVRESLLDQVLAPVTETDIPAHVAERIQTEERLRELRRKEKEEQHLYIKALIADDDTFRANTSFDFANFDEKENDVHVYKVRKAQTFGEFKQEMAEKIQLKPSEFRFWIMVNRQNRTVPVDDIRTKYAPTQPNLRLYLERATLHDENGQAVFPPPPNSADVILIFIKLFRPEYQDVHGIGHIYCRKDAKVHTIMDDLKQMAGMSPTESVLLYEEIKSTMIDLVEIHQTFTQAELQDGDILCIQRQLSAEEAALLEQKEAKATVDRFMAYELGKIVVHFVPNTYDQDSPEFELTLHEDMDYEKVAHVVGKELGVDSDKLRLINPYARHQGLKHLPQKRFAGLKLGKLFQNLNHHHQRPRLVYEKLNVSLEEMESKCPVTVTVCAPTLKDTQVLDILIPKDSGVNDLKAILIEKGIQFGTQELDHIRVFDEMDGKFDNEYDDKTWRHAVATKPTIKVYAEKIPDEELHANIETDGIIHVFHFQRTIHRTHSVPFKFVMKERLQARTGLDDKEWAKVKLFIVADDEEQATLVEGDEDKPLFYSHPYHTGDMLGLDHIDKSVKTDKTGAIFIRG
ncbi:hypothetical protein CU098_011576 [Rhizopus stolonifer]|uniref:ubiquitinyl hydrolase 1 n=1 Tax=Rhizopus stolonifer TaxID=4846 RepID=A0A367KRT5_RHIST|nr:hypothetical protein CU098_011576 [Rhizopus stolonifer]